MILYGFFSNTGFTEDIKIKKNELSKLIQFNNSKHLSFKTTNFQGGLYSSANCLDDLKDFFFFDNKSGAWLFFTGYIYNINDMEPDNKSLSQAEKLYRIFKHDGPDFVSKLNGDFTIVLYESLNSILYIYRDHLGIFPIAYGFFGNALFFSTDTISLCRAFSSGEQLNIEYFLKSFKMIDFNLTPNQNVKKLRPGYLLEFSQGVVTEKKYWHPEKIKINNSLTKKSTLSETKRLIKSAVKIRCNKRIATASHLSGGLDSGIVAALVRQEYANQKEFYGFSWSADIRTDESFGFDERKLVTDQSELNKIKPVFATLTPSDYGKIAAQSATCSYFPEENKIIKEASNRDIRIIFSGYGGDEFISKGNRGIDSDLFFGFHWGLLIKRYPITQIKRLLRILLYDIIMPATGIMSPPDRKEISGETNYLKKRYQKPDNEAIRNFYFYSSRRKLQLGFINCHYLQERTEEWYMNAVKLGISYRYPLLDKNLIEFALSIPSKFMFIEKYSRNLLREISSELLPESVRWKKNGGDPVAYHFAKKNLISCGQEYIHEIEKFKKVADLQFIDFEKLEKDVRKFQEKPNDKIDVNLFYSLFYIKQIDEFIKKYRKNCYNNDSIQTKSSHSC